jgi:type II secretory pathway pseudopilin PulG
MLSRSRKSASHRCSERGYILITLILFVALIAIAAVVMAPVIAFQVKRDREEELVHRGVQYSRAMKHYVKKFGRYPTRIEELENTNQVRFLRKRYKDPITGKDFKILRMGDVQMAFGAGIAGAVPPGGLNPAPPGAPGGPGGQAGITPGGINTVAMAGGLAAAAGMNGVNSPQAPGIGTPGSALVTPAPGQQDAEENAGNDAVDATANQGGSHPATVPGPPGTAGAPGQGSSGLGAQVFGGGPMVGVASTSKEKTIRIFNKKDHYNQWQFIYDPSSDRGGLLTTPNQPSLQGATTAIQTGVPGAPGAPGTLGTGISGQPGPGVQPGQPTQPGMQTPQMPPDQDQ